MNELLIYIGSFLSKTILKLTILESIHLSFIIKSRPTIPTSYHMMLAGYQKKSSTKSYRLMEEKEVQLPYVRATVWQNPTRYP